MHDVLAAVGFDPDALAARPVGPPVRPQHGPHGRPAHHALGARRPGDGVLLRACTSSGTGSTRPRSTRRTTGRRSRRPPGWACTSPRAACGRTCVGRSRPFCEWAAAAAARATSAARSTPWTPASSTARSTASSSSLIRIEADETTYNLHIALRFELELALIEGRLDVKDLPEAWDEASERLLGLRAADVLHGVLQDVHWGSGMIGYFPTYTLGNLMAAQLWSALSADLPALESRIERRQLRPAARVAARAHPPPRPEIRLPRAAAPGHRRGAAAWSRCWPIWRESCWMQGSSPSPSGEHRFVPAPPVD